MRSEDEQKARDRLVVWICLACMVAVIVIAALLGVDLSEPPLPNGG